MSFQSILFADSERANPQSNIADILLDLNFDQVISAIIGKRDPTLEKHFKTPLATKDAILYRQAVMKDLEITGLFSAIKRFTYNIGEIHNLLKVSKESYYKHEQHQTYLHAVLLYCSALKSLSEEILSIDLHSEGFISLREFIKSYISTDQFKKLDADTIDLQKKYSTIKYSIVVKGSSITVRAYSGEVDYTPVIEDTFEKFRQGVAKDYRAKISPGGSMSHIDSAILDRVALLYPDIFRELEEFLKVHTSFVDNTIDLFSREVQFYIAFLEYIQPMRDSNLQFSYPEILIDEKSVQGKDSFDLALATKLFREKHPVVLNDFFLKEQERIFVVSGPNHGGKTTFARTLGQLHFLASLGCPVPGADLRLFLFDRLFTHFERKEDIRNLRGKLQDDLIRIKEIVQESTSRSIIILNEIFSSTSLQDSVFLSKKILQMISDLDLLAVCVTFIDELASFNDKTVSMVSLVDSKDPSIRTFKLARIPATGLAYAISLAQKHGVTHQQIMKRISYESISDASKSGLQSQAQSPLE